MFFSFRQSLFMFIVLHWLCFLFIWQIILLVCRHAEVRVVYRAMWRDPSSQWVPDVVITIPPQIPSVHKALSESHTHQLTHISTLWYFSKQTAEFVKRCFIFITHAPLFWWILKYTLSSVVHSHFLALFLYIFIRLCQFSRIFHFQIFSDFLQLVASQ